MARPTLSRKLLLSLGTLGAVGAIAGLGTFANFTDSTSASHSVSSGSFSLALTHPGSVAMTAAITNLAPGDTYQRAADIANSGSIDMSAVNLTSSATTSSLLDSGANGLRLDVDACGTAWTESGSAPYTYTCAGGSTSVLSGVNSVIGAPQSLGSFAAGASKHLRFTWTLPTAADNTYRSLTSTLQYTFTATQRAGIAH